jgi:hypothetical protein
MFSAIRDGALSVGLFLGMLIFMEIGRRFRVRQSARDPDLAKAGFGAIEGSVLGLLGLLLAFTFSGAGTRFDARRQLIIEETNAIGTAYLRLDILSAAAQSKIREYFRQYLDARLNVYRKLPDVEGAKQELAIATSLQQEIWREAIASIRTAAAPVEVTVVLLPALNAMMDIAATRTMAVYVHPPVIIFVMLFALAWVSSLLAGYDMAGGKSRSWFHMLCFATAVAVTVFVILDLEYPRTGLIRVNAFDQALVDLRDSMK